MAIGAVVGPTAFYFLWPGAMLMFVIGAVKVVRAHPRKRRPPRGGYGLILLGVAFWVAGCFNALYCAGSLCQMRTTLYRQIAFGSIWTRVGGVVYLFGGIIAVVVISILGVLRIRRWATVLLAGAVLTWSLASIGLLISVAGAVGGFNPGASLGGAILGVGYWSCCASVIFIALGTVAVLVDSPRPKDTETDTSAL
jgi:hypothetical protein